MNITWGGALGAAAMFVLVLAAAGWVATRRLLRGGYRSTPLSAMRSGWRDVFRLIRVSIPVALILFGIRLFQGLGKDMQNIFLRHRPAVWSLTGLAIDVIFALVWAAFALRIAFFILTPDIERADRKARTRRAVLYAFAFWGLTVAVTIAGIALVVLVRGADRGLVIKSVGYIIYAITIVSALTRPAIAVGLPKPVRESFRIIRENWLGGSVTLSLAALPLGLVYIIVGMMRFVRMPLVLALGLEIPIAALSALCYLAFEGVVAAMYRRVM